MGRDTVSVRQANGYGVNGSPGCQRGFAVCRPLQWDTEVLIITGTGVRSISSRWYTCPSFHVTMGNIVVSNSSHSPRQQHVRPFTSSYFKCMQQSVTTGRRERTRLLTVTQDEAPTVDLLIRYEPTKTRPSGKPNEYERSPQRYCCRRVLMVNMKNRARSKKQPCLTYTIWIENPQ
ncbi:uncharacterized protein LOC111269059 isoform X1 [Varroa jacobsoni]|uniref:uncharacterized protein LOC111269059 isoform X1 n=1 Tax=Varroa jacobsoni TaxID=62625 RepID=UPI000BF9B371|nr:uncharacterized protein LOC111269059 isoform X1 [Varroa jacobsoni]